MHGATITSRFPALEKVIDSRESCNFAAMTLLVVAADDRTGAHEAAGACAEAGLGAVTVTTWADTVDAVGAATSTNVAVVDLASRHTEPAAAARRATAIGRSTLGRHAHKVDSTLRGNWAHEVAARQRDGSRQVVLVPAFPLAGRTCVAGIVYEGGRAVSEGTGGSDARARVPSNRPLDHLRAAGGDGVVELRTAGDLAAWLAAARPGIAVCDAADEADLAALGEVWARGESSVLFAGTSASIRAAAEALCPSAERVPPGPVAVHPPIVVVCGSLHPMARAQIEELRASADRARVRVVASAIPATTQVTASAAASAAVELATAGRRLVAELGAATLVLLGGDTAAAVLGDGAMLVGGTLAPGMPWGRAADGSGPLVITRAGGFGTSSSLVDLLVGGSHG